jgi:hypothetical protein
MPDWGPGFKKGTEKPECRKHGRDFMAGGVNEFDVGYEFCMACSDNLTTAGKAELRRRRGQLASGNVLARG